MLEVLKFLGYAAIGSILTGAALVYARVQYDKGYRDGRQDRRGLREENERRRA